MIGSENHWTGALGALGSSTTWAIGSTVYAILAKKSSPATINFWRAVCSFPLFILVSLIFSSFQSGNIFYGFSLITWENFIWLAVSIFSAYAFGDILFLLATRRLGVPTASAIADAYPLWAALAGWWFHNQLLSQVNILGLFFVIAGTAAVVLADQVNFFERFKNKSKQELEVKTTLWSAHYLGGALLALLTSFFWGLNSYSVARGGANLDAFTSNSIRMVLAIFMCPLISFILYQEFDWKLPSGTLKKVWPVFVLESFGGSFFYTYGLTHSSLAVGATLSSLSPIIALPFAIYLRMEKFSLLKLCALVVCILGVVFLVQK